MENVPVHVNHGTAAGRNNQESNKEPKTVKNKSFKKVIILLIVAVVVAVAVAFAVLSTYRSSVSSTIDGSKYQAVFFTNGQVYFGKLQTLNNDYLRLADIYYLQTKETDSSNPQQTSTEATPDVQLIKLGDEIHGPNDEMIISKDQVLFFENLKADGKVAQSISAFKKK